MLRRLARFALGALGAQHAVVVGRARQRGEDLLAVDEEAAVDRPRLGAERHHAGRGGAALRERLRIDGAVDRGCACNGTRGARCAPRARPEPSASRRPARPTTASSTRACSRRARSRRNSGRARPRPGNRSGNRRRDRPPPRDADREQAFRMHVAEVLDRESGLAIVLLRARRQHAATEFRARAISSAWASLKRNASGRKDRGVAVVQVERRSHRLASRVTAMPCGTARAACIFTIDEIIALRAVAAGRLTR